MLGKLAKDSGFRVFDQRACSDVPIGSAGAGGVLGKLAKGLRFRNLTNRHIFDAPTGSAGAGDVLGKLAKGLGYMVCDHQACC